MGWIMLGWFLTWAAVELGMLQRLLDTKSLTGGQWAVVLGLSLVTPTLVWIDKTIQLRRQKASQDEASGSASAPAPAAT
jgi:Ca2+-transporting ATPase